MEGENRLRVALLLAMTLTICVTVYHRIQARRAGERVSHREEGYVFFAVLRFAGLGLWGATFGYLLFPAYFHWAAMPLPEWLRWSAVVSGVLCAPLMYWTLSSLGKNLTDTVVTRAAATLVTAGPYRWVRHPFYVTAALLMASATLMAANWLIGVMSVLVFLLLAIRTPKEEQMLLDRFGDSYRQYRERTGRFIPRLRN